MTLSQLKRCCLSALPALLFVLVAPGCDRAVNKEAAKAKQDPEVYFSKPKHEVITDFEDFTGRAEAEKTVEITTRVTGYLQKILFKDGDEVTADTPLFEIDPRPYKAIVDRTEATLAQTEARVKRAEADFNRIRNLFNRGAASREEIELSTDTLAESRAAVGVAKADYDTAALNLKWTTVTAPISGRISRRMVDVGNLVRADNTLLTSVVSIDNIYAYFDIDERTVLSLRKLIREGKMKSRTEAEVPVLVALADQQGFKLKGTIDFSENRLDPGTGTLQVRAVISNPKPQGLSPGLFLRIRLPIGDPHDGLTIAEEAVGTDQGQKFVYVIDDKDQVARRAVKVGSLNKDRRVIAEGLKEEDRVVVRGLQRIRPGIKVKPSPVEKLAERDNPAPTPAGEPSKSVASAATKPAPLSN